MRPADAGFAVGQRRQRGNAPARHCRAGSAAFGGGLRCGAPTPQQQRGDAGALGGDLQSPPGNHRQPAHLADHRGERRFAQSFFKRPENVVVARGADQHDSRRVEAMCGEPRPVQIALLEAPQDHAVWNPSGDGGSESGSGGAVLLVRTGAENLVQRAQCQSAARQSAVERRDPKRQYPVAHRVRPLDAPDALL